MPTDARQARKVLWLLFAVNTLNIFDRQLVAALTEPIRKEFLLSDTAIGWLSTAFILTYATVGVPVGRLADRWMRTKVLALGVAVWSVFTVAVGLTWNYASLFVVRTVIGIGEASAAPASTALIGDLYPAERRARALSVFMLGVPAGVFLSSVLGSVLANAYGWRAAFFVAGLPGLMAAWLMLRVPEPVHGSAEAVPPAQSAPGSSATMRVLRIPTMWWIILAGGLLNFNAYAFASFLPAFIQRYHKLELRQANLVAALVLGGVGFIGLPLGGWAADAISRRRRDGRMLLTAAAMLLTAPLVYLALGRPPGDVTTFALLLSCGWTLFYVYYAAMYAVTHDVVEPGLRATAVALSLFGMYVLGGSLGASVVGALSDRYARQAMAAAGVNVNTIPEAFRATGLHSALYIVPWLFVVLAVVLWLGSRTVAADMEKLEAR